MANLFDQPWPTSEWKTMKFISSRNVIQTLNLVIYHVAWSLKLFSFYNVEKAW